MTTEREPKSRSYIGPDGRPLDRKPEDMTQLKGSRLVFKDFPIIIWRGRLDTLCADIIEAQERGLMMGEQAFVDELREVLKFVHALLVCEFTGREMEEFHLLGLDAAALRERSHNPRKYFGHSHFMADCRMGPLAVALNRLRAQAREVEALTVAAFKEPPRLDLVRALNRLSSLLYIMMFMHLPAGFQPESAGI